MPAGDEWAPKRGLAQILRFVRNQHGWTQEEFAERVQAADPTGAGVSASTVAKLETGDRSPSPRTLAAIASAAGTSAADLRRVALDWEEAADRGAQPSKLFEILNRHFGARSTSEYAAVSAPEADGATESSSGVRGQLAAETSASTHEIRIGLAPPGTRWLVPAEALGTDDDGGMWIDPSAGARAHGPREGNATVERWDDGTFHVDVSRLDAIPPRDTQRQTYRASVVSEEPPKAADLAETYAQTRIIINRSEDQLVLDPELPLPEMPEGWSTVHVITAWNPRSRLLLPGENAERNRVLERQLRRLGLDPLPAMGASPYGSWHEESFAVVDAPRAEILELAADWEQNAIFRWDDDGLHLEWTEPGR